MPVSARAAAPAAWIGVTFGRPLLGSLHRAGDVFRLGYRAVKSAWLERGRLVEGEAFGLMRQVIAEQIYWSVIHTWRFFLLVGLLLGLLVITLLDGFLTPLGLGDRTPGLACRTLLVEVLPLIFALMLIARSGTAIATELGYMAVRRQIEALELSGINREFMIVLPRLIGGMLATVSLWAYASAAALLGGTMLGQALGLLGPAATPADLVNAIDARHVALGVAKSAIFGAVIPLSACVEGLAVRGAYTEIPKANVGAATRALVLCLVLNVPFSLL